jgi:hypothetical protein
VQRENTIFNEIVGAALSDAERAAWHERDRLQQALNIAMSEKKEKKA